MGVSPHKFRSRDGVELDYTVGDKATSGDTTVVAIGTDDAVKLYGVGVSADATLTGDITVKIGSNQITTKMRNAIVGGVHWLFPITGCYIQGALGEDVVINNSVAEDISYSVYTVTVTP